MRIYRAILLVLLCLILTQTLQEWVGSITIYGPDFEPPRATMHQAILGDEPESSEAWELLPGAANTSVRVLAVHLAELIRETFDVSVHRAYRIIDSVSLFAIFLLLFLYLRRWLDDAYCLIGVLYVTIVAVLTYQLHYFHPWDRIGLVGWLIVLFLFRARRTLLAAGALVVCMVIKYDAIFLPLLHGLHTYRSSERTRSVLSTAALLSVAVATYALLWKLFPGPTLNPGTREFVRLFTDNLEDLRVMGVTYPPLLAFLLPLLLAIPARRDGDRFVWSSRVFGFLLFIPFLVFSRFREVRAEMPLLLLLLPAALLNLRDLLSRSAPKPGPPSPGSR